MSRGRALVWRGLAIALGLAIAEGLLRVAGLAYPAWDRPTAGLGEWGVPHARGWAVGEARQWIEHNSIGVRDVEHAIPKPSGTHRVLVVGDSYVAAYEVEREQAFPAVTEERLRACPALAGRAVEVVNLSKRGYGTAEELLAFRQLGVRHAPDQVVLAFFPGNDFRNNSAKLKASGRPYFRLEGDRLVLDESYAEDPAYQRWIGWPGDVWYGLVRHVRLVQVARHLRRQLKALADSQGAGGLDEAIHLEPPDEAWREAWALSLRLVRQFRDEAEAAGARFLWFTISTPAQVHPDPAARAAVAARLGAPDVDHPQRRFEAYAAAHGIAWLSSVEALRRAAESRGECVHGFPGPWPCEGHWNALGHRVAGETLAEALCAQLSEAPPESALARDPASAQSANRSPASIERASRP